jgi:hypothetical protein
MDISYIYIEVKKRASGIIKNTGILRLTMRSTANPLMKKPRLRVKRRSKTNE